MVPFNSHMWYHIFEIHGIHLIPANQIGVDIDYMVPLSRIYGTIKSNTWYHDIELMVPLNRKYGTIKSNIWYHYIELIVPLNRIYGSTIKSNIW